MLKPVPTKIKNHLTGMSIRYQIFTMMLLVSILPVILIAMFTSKSILDYLNQQNIRFYSTTIRQISSRIDFYFRNYANVMEEITSLDNFELLMNAPVFKSKSDERFYVRTIGEFGNTRKGGTIRKIVSTKINGEFLYVDIDKPSLLRDTPYRFFEFSSFSVNVDIQKLFHDPIFDAIRDDRNLKMILGKPGKDILFGYESEKKSLILFPYYKDETEKLKRFFLIVLNYAFFYDMVKDINTIRLGTLYILDQNGQILSSNHPGDDDYYDYDSEKKKYILGDAPFYDPDEGMSFRDYSLLNTDPEIIENPVIQRFIHKEMEEGIIEDTQSGEVSFQGIRYQFIGFWSGISNTRLIYLHPVEQISRPVFRVIMIILLITFFLIVTAAGVSFIYSRRITRPIEKLMTGSQEVSRGNYQVKIPLDGFTGELRYLGNSYNNMVEELGRYSSNMEELVAQRTRELKAANEKMIEDLQMAQKIQKSLIPGCFFDNKGTEIFGEYHPMESLGGDLYDVVRISDTKVGISIIDVCGHGVSAALIMTMAKVSFQNHFRKNHDPAIVMKLVNEDLCNIFNGSGDYLTAYCGFLDLETLLFEYSNAGHTTTYLLRNSENLMKLELPGPVIGALKNVRYLNAAVQLQDQDKLIFYTDGIPEARNSQGEMLDYERFESMILSHAQEDPGEFIRSIISEIKEFIGPSIQTDDITLLVAGIDIHNVKEFHFNIDSLSIKNIPDDPDVSLAVRKYQEALELAGQSEYESSSSVLIDLADQNLPDNMKFRITVLLGYTLYHSGKQDEAIKAWNDAEKLVPEDNRLTALLESLKDWIKSRNSV